MDAIGCFVIPGGPFAIEGGKENVPRPKDRAYAGGREKFELWLIEEAKTRGMPILAICAGSWRLYKSYGETTKVFDEGAWERHKSKKAPNFTFHPVALQPHGFLSPGHQPVVVSGFTSVHWAAAHEDPAPLKLLQVDAREAHPERPIEAFSSKFGALHLGVQWHSARGS